jgi:molybdopterin molybdotransferase
MVASVGLSRVAVCTPLRVAVFSSGDELAQPGEALPTGAVYDANRPMLLAMLARLGMVVSDMGVLPDGKEAIRVALADASAGHDAIVTSAGVSVGDEDHIRAAVESLGSLDFQGVALKPGSPMTAGHIGGVPFFGLPGNPVAMMVNFLMLVRPGLLSLAGALVGPPRRVPVQAGFAAASKPGRREFLRAKLAVEDGVAVVTPCARGGSGILSSLVECDGLIELEESLSTVTAGMTLPFIPLAELGL